MSSIPGVPTGPGQLSRSSTAPFAAAGRRALHINTEEEGPDAACARVRQERLRGNFAADSPVLRGQVSSLSYRISPDLFPKGASGFFPSGRDGVSVPPPGHLSRGRAPLFATVVDPGWERLPMEGSRDLVHAASQGSIVARAALGASGVLSRPDPIRERTASQDSSDSDSFKG